MPTSTIPHHNVVLVVLCRANGALVETLHDEFGLIERSSAGGGGFTALIEAADVAKVGRSLRTAAANRAALDWQFDVRLARGTAPLYFTAVTASRGFVILGSREPICGSREDGIRILEIAAHDLRNPVSGILAASEYLVEDAGGRLDLSLLRSIQSSSRLILRRIDEMLEAPALAGEQPRMHFQSTDLASLVDRCAEASRPLAENRNVRLEVRTSGTIPRVVADPRKMSRAVTGLLRNRIKWSRPGSRVEVLVDAPGAEATITVRDEGPEIPAAHLRNLFDPFRMTRPKRGLMVAHTSLTLAAVKRIVEEHRGTIQVESEGRKGSIFTLRVPLTSNARGKAGRVERVVRSVA